MLFNTESSNRTWTHTAQQQVLRCTQVNCTCQCFQPQRLNIRSCDQCTHGWVAHDQVEVVHSSSVSDLSSLILLGTNALPIRMKILLDRLFSVLTHTHVFHILHTHQWSLQDYVRGYMLQDSMGKDLDRWVIMTPEEEFATLRQFLRFGETKPIVELMMNHLEQNLLCGGTEQRAEVLHSVQRSKPSFLQQICDVPQTPEKTGTGSGGESSARLQEHISECGGGETRDRGLRASLSGSSSPRKARVSCGSCGKTFYDKGTLKIHYNAVHLKIKHRCTIDGCNMMFSSLRSRNRHSANPNPRLHTPALQNTHSTPTHPQLTGPSSTSPSFHSQPAADGAHYIHPQHANQHTAPIPDSGGGAFLQLNTIHMLTYRTDAAPKRKSRKSSRPVKIRRDTADNPTFKTNNEK